MRPSTLAPSMSRQPRSFFHLLPATLCLLTLFIAFHSSAAAQCPDWTPPQGATTVSATSGKAKISLSWGTIQCATTYNVYRSDDGGAFYNGGSTSATSLDVSSYVYNGHTYAFYIRAQNYWGYGSASNTASATLTLDAPSASVSPGKAKITVTWGGVSDADTYAVSRAQDGGSFTQIASNLTTTSYADSGVSNNHTFSYQVRAHNSAGDSQPSSSASTFLQLRAPSGLSLVRDGSGNVTFSWGSVSDADSYILYRSPDAINGSYFGTITGTSKVDTAPYSPTTYYYLQAQNAAGVSPVSNMVSTEEIGCTPSSCSFCTLKGAPLDGASGGKSGGQFGDPVNLATGREFYLPEADLTVYNSSGPSVVWQRQYYGTQALKGYSSPGFSAGWVHTYDVSLQASAGTWGDVNLQSYTGGVESLTPAFDGGGQPTGVLTTAPGSPYFARGVAGTSAGVWQSVTLTWKDGTQWQFTPLSGGTYALTKITSRTGQSINLTWNASRALTQITDAASSTILLSLTYGADGRLASVTDVYNRQIVYGYEAPFGSDPGRLKSVSQIVTAGTANPPARWTFTYDTTNGQQLKTITVPSPTGTGNSTATINYDSRGRVTSLVDANNNKRAYTYNSTNTLVQVKDAANNVVMSWTRKFSTGKLDTGVTDANNKSTTVEYLDVQNPSSATRVTDKNGKITTYTYDQYGNVRTVTSPRNVTTTYTYDYTAFASGRLTSVQEGTKTATTFTYYEPSGLMQSVTQASPTGTGTVTTAYTYDTLGNVLTVVAPGNNAATSITTTYNYTTDGAYSQAAKAGQPLTVTDNLGHATHLRYDAQGRVTSATDAIGNETDASYTLAGQLDAVTLPTTGQTGTGHGRRANSYLYAGGPLTATTVYDESNAQVRQITYAYGLEGETLSVAGSTEPVTYTYDALYRLKTLKDGNNNTTTYSYNSVGLVSQVQMPGGETIQFPSYDFAGHLLQRIDGNGVTTNYLYTDAENQLTDIQYPATTSLNVHLGYDSYGRRNSMTDATGSQSYSYNDLDMLTSRTTTYTGLAAQTISYAYYADGSRQSMTTPAGTFNYSYDATGRPSSMNNPFSETTGWTYFDNNRLDTQTLGNGAQTTYTYNALSQLTALVNKTSGGTTLSQFTSMTHDGAGNRTSLTASFPAVSVLSGTTSYQYDSKDQLTQEQTTRGGGFTDSFGYDSAGNPTSFKSTTKAYNTNNQQTGTGFTHDGNGNPTTYGGVSLSFDPENRLTSYGSTLTAGYRGDGLRAWKQNAGGRTYFLYDGVMPALELDSAGAVIATNTFGANGMLSRRTSGASTFYTFDPQGGVAQWLDAGQSVQSSHQFAAHGGAVSGAAAPFGYGAQWGYYTDAETGLQLLRHRYYDPQGGRFLTHDPISYRGGVNLYSYVTNNATNRADPSGLMGGGLLFSGSSEIGAGPGGAGATGSAGWGLFYDRAGSTPACGCGGGSPAAGLTQGGFAEFGAFAGAPDMGPHYPSLGDGDYPGGPDTQKRFVEGGFAGIGGGPFLTNANTVSDLKGPFRTYSLNVGIGPVKVGLQLSYGCGTWVVSGTVGPSLPGASISSYPTNTWTTDPGPVSLE